MLCMTLTRSQLITIGVFTAIAIALLCMRTKPEELIDREKLRALNLQATDITILRQEAVSSLSDDAKTRIQIMEAQLDEASDEEKIDLLKSLSSVWYSAGEVGIAGYYAEEVATIAEDAPSWGIAGTTYGLCVQRSKKDKEKSFCLDKALIALETAISLDPEEVSYALNRAILLAENPPQDNPMKGVQLLLELNKKLPENVSVINNIARFALQTNQLDRAEERLLGALELEPNNQTTNCLLVQLYMAKGENNRASIYQEKCK